MGGERQHEHDEKDSLCLELQHVIGHSAVVAGERQSEDADE
jgi:hypothetical protein